MSKIDYSLKDNKFCPQTLFLYGTGKGGEKPNFGLFCWFSYTWDSELGVMACIGGEKLTKDRILKDKIFSANLVTEELLPLANYLGTKNGHDAGKMDIDIEIERGHVLDVPVVAKSPVVFELEAKQFIHLDDGMVMLCKIRNVLHDESLENPDESNADKMNRIAPVRYDGDYYGWTGKFLGHEGDDLMK